MKKTIILIIAISFLAPTFHFIEHNHIYNPFSNKLEHYENTVSIKKHKKNYSDNDEISIDLNSFNKEICKINLFNTYIKNFLQQNTFNQNSISNYHYKHKIIIYTIIQKPIITAPKNSPPFFI